MRLFELLADLGGRSIRRHAAASVCCAPAEANEYQASPDAATSTPGFNRLRTSDAPYKGAAVFKAAARVYLLSPPSSASMQIGCSGTAESFPIVSAAWLVPELRRCSRSPSSSCDCAGPRPSPGPWFRSANDDRDAGESRAAGSLSRSERKKLSSCGMPLTTVPFQTIVPSKSMSIWMTSGRTGGGGLLVCGMSSLVACVMTGIDMISTMMQHQHDVDERSRVDLHHRCARFGSCLLIIDMKNYLEAFSA